MRECIKTFNSRYIPGKHRVCKYANHDDSKNYPFPQYGTKFTEISIQPTFFMPGLRLIKDSPRPFIVMNPGTLQLFKMLLSQYNALSHYRFRCAFILYIPGLLFHISSHRVIYLLAKIYM